MGTGEASQARPASFPRRDVRMAKLVLAIGVPWSWLAVFLVSSFVALRKHHSKIGVALGSLAGAVVS